MTHQSFQPQAGLFRAGAGPRLAAVLVAGVIVLACGSNNPNMLIPPATNTITGFGCTPSLISGQTGSLSWSVQGVATVTIEPGLGTVTASPIAVSPAQTTTYTLSATNAGGTVTATCTLTVYPAGSGGVTLLAGTPGPSIVDGTLAQARFSTPQGVASDASGNLFVADPGDQALRKVDATGVTTLLSGLPALCPKAVATDAAGNVYFPEGASIQQITPGGSVSTYAGSVTPSASAGSNPATLLATPQGLAVDSQGNLFVADPGSNLIFQVTPAKVVSVYAGTPGAGAGYLDGLSGAAQFSGPTGITVDASDNVFVVDAGNSAIRKITQGGSVLTVASVSALGGGLAVDAGGTLYAGLSASIAMVGQDSSVATLAGLEGTTGYLDGTGTAARFTAITGLAWDASGNLVAADAVNHVLRTVTLGGVATTLAGTQAVPTVYPNPAVAADGTVYLAAPDATLLNISPAGVVGVLAGTPGVAGAVDGLGASARFGLPAGVVLDAAGNLYVTDAVNATIRRVSPGGQVDTLYGTGQPGSQNGLGRVASFKAPTGIALDAQGNLYVADTGNALIRKLATNGQVSTLAGTPGVTGNLDGALGARFNQPNGIAVDGTGMVYVADTGNAAIRKITPAGVVSTLACIQSGSTVAAQFKTPLGLTLDGQGNLYVVDPGVGGVWQISPAGVASLVPLSGAEGQDLQGTGLAYAGGKLYVAAPMKVLTIAMP